MKKSLLTIATSLFLFSCNSDKTGDKKGELTQVDSLLKQVDDGHDAGMLRYGKMKGLKNKVDAALDSISKLAGKAREEAAPYEQKLREVGQELNTAIIEMDKWMESYNPDSALNDLQARVRYLTDERSKVGRIKDLILQSVAMADSILRK